MLLDWLTLVVPFDSLPPALAAACRCWGDRICRYDPATGEEQWVTSAWDSIRSDSHQVAMRAGADALWIQGSPQRALADGDQVFGSPTAALEVKASALAMLRVALTAETLPAMDILRLPAGVRVTRVDVTGHYDCGSVEGVREVLAALRGVEGGRYRVSQQAGDTVYWSHRSRLRAGKAYAKGPHLRYEEAKQRRGLYTDEEHALADRLVRLELRLGSQYWRERAEKPWQEWTPEDFRAVWSDYFERMVSEMDISESNDEQLRARVIRAAPTEGQGKSAWATWCMIRAMGWQVTRDNVNRSTWYRHLQVLKRAGLTDADLSHGEAGAIPVRKLAIRKVESWRELRAA